MSQARKTDPITSHLAANDSELNNERQRIKMLEFLLEHSGLTSNELGRISSVYDRYQFARRLSEMAKLGTVINTNNRKCRVSGRLAMTWCAA
jgi:hypothetical protein|tara:strand:+ start:387 stop:662 length:276 start_codon:yes stop_codon:yes gene_type:complete